MEVTGRHRPACQLPPPPISPLTHHSSLTSSPLLPLQLLENAPFQWEDTKKATLNAREKLNPLQALQAEKIKEEAEDWVVSDFRKVRPPPLPYPTTPHSPYLTPRLRLPQGVPRRRRRRAVQARVRRGVLRLARPLAPQDRRARGGGGDAQREVRALRRGGGAVQGDQAVPPGHPRAQARVGPRRARRAHLRRLAPTLWPGECSRRLHLHLRHLHLHLHLHPLLLTPLLVIRSWDVDNDDAGVNRLQNMLVALPSSR